MNRIMILYGLFLLLMVGCGGEHIFAPDHIFLGTDQQSLLVSNRNRNELLKIGTDLNTVDKRICFSSPVNDLVIHNDRIWVVCDGANGSMYELDSENMSVVSEMKLGYDPSAIVYNHLTNTFWITQRFNNELWEVDPTHQKVLAKITVGREPVDIVSYANDSLLMVVNNLPGMPATDYPIAAGLTVVDVVKKEAIKQILLPNGSTDIKSIAVDKGHHYAYVAHLLARYQLPTSQVDRGWMSTNVLSIINLQTSEWETTVLLDTPQKGAANPYTVVVTPDNSKILVTLSGVHEIACIDRNQLHQRLADMKNGTQVVPSSRKWDDIPNDAGFLYGIREFIPTNGKGPRGLGVVSGKVYTANYFTGEVVQIDLSSPDSRIMKVGSALISTKAGKGEMYFHDASICFLQWQSCASCHPNDARVDGLNWDLLNDGAGNPKNTKSMLLSHQTPPCMITGIRKDAETAVRSGIKYILFADVADEIPEAMNVYLKSLKPKQSPYLVDGKLSPEAQQGKMVFDLHCASCHDGPYYTDQKQYPVAWATQTETGKKMDVPTLIEAWRTAPYLYDGRSYTMQEMLKIHGTQEPVNEMDLNNLALYILSL